MSSKENSFVFIYSWSFLKENTRNETFCWIGPVCHFTRKCIINKLTGFSVKIEFFHFLIFPERRQFVYWNIDFQVKIHFSGSKIRLVTLDASIDLLKGMVLSGEGKSFLADTHFAQLEGIKEESTLLLRNFYKVIFREKNKVFFWVEVLLQPLFDDKRPNARHTVAKLHFRSLKFILEKEKSAVCLHFYDQCQLFIYLFIYIFSSKYSCLFTFC